jgi:exodeoxyribonuclease V alpha subunit
MSTQKIAAKTAVQRHFCIISGGPGSGKTSTVVNILALLLEQNPNLTIALAAPTGKAKVRLQEAIKQSLDGLNCAISIKKAMPQEAYTIHSLLGSKLNSPYFRSHIGNLLPYNVVVVDEASMVDLALMTKLAQAIPKSARWILLGDKDQLASVEAGTVLGDICEASLSENYQENKENAPTLQENIVLLDKSYRFSENSGIWKLAQAVKQGQSEKALRILKSENYPDVNWHHLAPSEGLPRTLIEQIVIRFTRCLEEKSPEKVLQRFEQLRVLCATHRGPYGVEAINRQIEGELNKKGLIRTKNRWYHGQPIMITRNDYTLKLFNGDIGIILRNPDNRNDLQAFFPSVEGEIRLFWPNRLPEHETVYAMTIHKSQGSEFDNVLILLPQQFSTLLTRELIYTGITRAKQVIHIWGNEQVLSMAVSKKISRSSGLREQLSRDDQ